MLTDLPRTLQENVVELLTGDELIIAGAGKEGEGGRKLGWKESHHTIKKLCSLWNEQGQVRAEGKKKRKEKCHTRR